MGSWARRQGEEVKDISIDYSITDQTVPPRFEEGGAVARGTHRCGSRCVVHVSSTIYQPTSGNWVIPDLQSWRRRQLMLRAL